MLMVNRSFGFSEYYQFRDYRFNIMETTGQILLRTALRYDRIKHLDLDTKKALMLLPEDDFNREFNQIVKRTSKTSPLSTTTELTNSR